MKIPPFVSVIIPTYNRAALLPRAINSVLSQTYKKLVCIVVDDGSTDHTKEVVKSVKDDRIVYLRHKTNRQTSATRNTGIKHSRGELIAFLDDDDEWLPTKLEKQVRFIKSLPEKIGMVYCWMDYYDHNGKIIREVHPTLRGYVFPQVIDEQRLGGCPTLLVRREVIDDIVRFDESLPRGNDGDFIRRVCQKYEVDYVPEVLVKVHVGYGSKRISDNDKQSIKNAIKTQTVKFKKFELELRKLPKQKSNIYAIIAFHHSQLEEWKECLRNYIKAINTYPFSFKIYKHIRHSLKKVSRQ